MKSLTPGSSPDRPLPLARESACCLDGFPHAGHPRSGRLPRTECSNVRPLPCASFRPASHALFICSSADVGVASTSRLLRTMLPPGTLRHELLFEGPVCGSGRGPTGSRGKPTFQIAEELPHPALFCPLRHPLRSSQSDFFKTDHVTAPLKPVP